MASLTTWNRVEPSTRSATLPALAARIADPLWMVGRQAQAGELTGSDTASPVWVRLTYEIAPIDRWHPGLPDGAAAGVGYPDGVPAEAIVDAVPSPSGLRDHAAGGQRLLRALGRDLADRYRAALRREFGLRALEPEADARADARSRRWSIALAGRALDGAALRAALGDAATLRARLGVAPADAAAFDVATANFALWWDGRHPGQTGAWQSNRLAAPFAVAAGDVTLAAPEHRGGRVDWHTFDVADHQLTAAGADLVEQTSVTLPTHLSYPGMPAQGWWQFEDGAVDLGRLDTAPTDLGRLLLAEFALLYGNDFFVVPVAVPAGSVCRITGLTVGTSYGETVDVPSTVDHDARGPDGPRWRLFQIADAGGNEAAGLLVLPPCAVDVVDGPVEEEVLFARDEMANLAWGIELRVTGPAGSSVERREVEATRAVTPPSDSTLRYRLTTRVPESWLPLTPRADGVLEQRGSHPPTGELMGGVDPFTLDTVELPRTGRRVRRATHLARGEDGTTHVWSSWTAGPGRSGSGSGLRHDDLTHERSV